MKNSLFNAHFIGSVVSWSSIKEVDSHKRLHNLLCTSHEPPLKKTKTGNDEECVTSPVLVEDGRTADDEDLNNKLQSNSNDNIEVSPVVTKVKDFCNKSATLDDKEIALLWEELTSIETDQVCNCSIVAAYKRCMYVLRA